MLERGDAHRTVCEEQVNRTTTSVLTGALAAGIVLTASSTAFASGFAAARFGGEHGNPTETNASSIYYNPAGFGLSENGTQLMLDFSLAFRTATFDRAEGQISPYADGDPFAPGAALEGQGDEAVDANAGESTLNNTIYSPMIGVTTNFGVDMPLKLGLAFYAPFGGQAVWDEDENADAKNAIFPGSGDDSVRWFSIDGTIRTLALSLALAYEIESINLSFGLAGNLLLSDIVTLRARNADGTDNLVTPDGRLKEGRSFVDVSSTDYSIGVGTLWEAMEDQLWVGLSWQSRPNLTGEMIYEGTLDNALATAEPSTSDVKFTSTLPDIYRLGARFRPVPAWELRLFGDYTRWSAVDQQCLLDATVSNDDLETVCEITESGARANTTPDSGKIVQVFKRDWQDAFGVRLGASWFFSDKLEFTAGAGYDGNAIPDETLDPALMDMNKLTFSLGTHIMFTDYFQLGVTGTEVLYFERDTSETGATNSFEAPSRQPGNGGVYNQNIFVLNTNARFLF